MEVGSKTYLWIENNPVNLYKGTLKISISVIGGEIIDSSYFGVFFLYFCEHFFYDKEAQSKTV